MSAPSISVDERLRLLVTALHVALSYVEPQTDPAAVEALEGCRYVYADECDRPA